MKWLTVILSSWILFLTILPCVDAHGGHYKASIELSGEKTHHTDCDQCSPFCTCNCCSSPVIFGSAPQLFFSVPTISYTTSYILPAIPVICTIFWQPPKIA